MMMASTSAQAPYDSLRAMRCMARRADTPGKPCGRNLGEIDWNAPATHSRICPKCGAPNVVYIPERAVAPLE